MAQDDKARANALIDKYDGYLSSLDVNGLCDELSTIVMPQTYTVYEVFNVLRERGYSQKALEDVATNLTNRINDTNLIELAKSMHGATLLARIQYLMNCEANPNQAICQRISTAFQRANDILREQDKKKPNDTSQPRKLSEEEINYYKGKAKKGEKFNEEVVWELPNGGTGFTVYKRDDVAEDGYDQIGTKDTVERVIVIAQLFSTSHSDRPAQRLLQIGDLSRPGGLDTSQHKEHQSGKMFDMRPIRNDSTTGNSANLNVYSSSYSQKLTKEFILLVVNKYPGTLILFADPSIYNDPNFSGFVKRGGQKLNKRTGRYEDIHGDHLHVRFPGGD